MAVSFLFPLVNLSLGPTTGTFLIFGEKTAFVVLFPGAGDLQKSRNAFLGGKSACSSCGDLKRVCISTFRSFGPPKSRDTFFCCKTQKNCGRIRYLKRAQD